MAENLTRQHGLVHEITNKDWFANPVGKQGYDVILLERVGNGGMRFYHSLKPGETLRIAERLLSNYIALEVDMRHARAFPVSGSFNTSDRGKKVTLELNIRYHVSNAQIVAMETDDPLGELQSKVNAILNRDLQGYSERDITSATIERIVQGIGQVPHLGLTVEDVEIISFSSDSRIDSYVVEEENVQHSTAIEAAKRRARIEAQSELEDADLQIKSKRHNTINLSNLNVFLHEYPELIPQVLATFSQREQKMLDAKIEVVQSIIQAYIAEQAGNDGEIDPRKIGNILRDALASTSPQLPDTSDLPQITWADDVILSESKETKQSDGKVTVILNEPPTPPKDNPDLQSDLNDKNYKVSISFPLLLSKRFDSVFLFQLYLPEHRSRVSRNIRAQFRENSRIEFVDQSIIKIGQKIQVEFYSSHVEFSKPIIKLVDEKLTRIIFLGSPKDTCQTGAQNVRVSISDVETQQEIESFNLEVRVVDFSFDHISRPLLSRASAVVLGIGSFAMFLLTLLEQIDKTIGLTSGTAAGVFAVVAYANFYNLYQRMRPSSL